MSAEAMGAGYFFPQAPTRPPAPTPEDYLEVQKRGLYHFEKLLAEICERGDRDSFEKLTEIIEDMMGHGLWVLAEPGRRYELLRERRPLPDEDK